MEAFFETHQDDIVGVLTTFDRIIFKGHLTSFFPRGAFARFLWRQGVLLKDFKPYVESESIAGPNGRREYGDCEVIMPPFVGYNAGEKPFYHAF